MTPIKTIVDYLKSEFNLNFNKLSYHRLKDEEEKAYKTNPKGSYKLAIAADIKELISDKNSDLDTKNFYIKTLTDEFLRIHQLELSLKTN